MLQHVQFSSPGKDTLLDLGCGDAVVLIQALETFPSSQLVRAIGVDLDKALLETTKEGILQERNASATTNDDHDSILSRLELYHGDLTVKDEPLTTILSPSKLKDQCDRETTMRQLVDECSHLFVYLLPEALSKLAPLLLEAIEVKQKVVLSMRWEIPELAKYQLHGGVGQQYYVYDNESRVSP
ncbi:hypothetical protein BGZ50_008732 [Haplosporangium sp. Z 11]|nr:hypothetical protein BGZ50_008732 [Haplosporangium sp. Z 11]